MLAPKKYKWRKHHRGFARGFAKGGSSVDFGEYGLLATSLGFVTSRQIEAVRVSISRELKREGNVWIRIFPHKPFTKRPAETRMGKGKGDVDHYVAVVKPGRVMFEIGGVAKEKAYAALARAKFKISVSAKIVERTLL